MKQKKSKQFYRKCPICNTPIGYTTKQQYKNASLRKSKCKDCKWIHKKNKAKRLTDKIMRLYKKNLLNREIAEILNINKETVSQRLRTAGLKSNFILNKKLKIIDNKFGICTSCGEKLELKNFADGRNGEYKYTKCHKCRYATSRRNTLSSLDKYFAHLVAYKRRKSRQKGFKFNLDKQFLINLYNLQKGKCFYTNEKLLILFSTSRNNNLCIDRIDNSKGYIKENVVFSTIRFNRIKSDLSLSEIKRFMPNIYKKIIKNFPDLINN